jgi:hypothetical protein
MADGFDIHLDDARAGRLKAAAAAAGLAPADYALSVLDHALDADWTESLRRLETFDQSGVAVPLEDALDAFARAVEQRLAEPR